MTTTTLQYIGKESGHISQLGRHVHPGDVFECPVERIKLLKPDDFLFVDRAAVIALGKSKGKTLNKPKTEDEKPPTRTPPAPSAAK